MRENELSDAVVYNRSLFAHETEAMRACRDWLTEEGVGGMHLGPEEGSYLAFFARLIGAKKVIEIGTLGGYSGLWIAQALPNDGKLYTLEKKDVFAVRAQQFFIKAGVAAKVEVLVGDAHRLLPSLSAMGPFDLVFVDADKSGYPDYLKWSAQNLRSGGLLIADNTYLYGTVWQSPPPKGTPLSQWNAMRAFNQEISSGQDWNSILLPTFEGLIVAQRL